MGFAVVPTNPVSGEVGETSSNVSFPDGLTPVQIGAIEALSKCRTIGGAAKVAGVSRQTLYTWMNDDPAFRLAYRQVKQAAFEGIALGLLNLGDSAIEGYAAVLENPGRPGAATLGRTSESVISQLFKLRDIIDIEERFALIEERLEAVAHGQFD